ncbi:hypothetical protein [Vampirovibrio chlorellavorus]|uniref:hypothetical protein n=1 Tax=Vampirovibrio chlorellavorus TaxID=758823 RepID=UPI0026EE999A|nr:hypothetical protein [Vampirovibrio chlorellavorus]
MPITFDTLDELKAFYRAFSLEEQKTSSRSKTGLQSEPEIIQPKKRGRKPGQTLIKQAVTEKTPKKRGPKPKAPGAKKLALVKPKRDKSNTLTAKIQDAIRGYLNKSGSFTANDIYDVLSKKEPEINKQSVITSVLKQMNSTFSDISVTERPGNGPRPVKLYNA